MIKKLLIITAVFFTFFAFASVNTYAHGVNKIVELTAADKEITGKHNIKLTISPSKEYNDTEEFKVTLYGGKWTYFNSAGTLSDGVNYKKLDDSTILFTVNKLASHFYSKSISIPVMCKVTGKGSLYLRVDPYTEASKVKTSQHTFAVLFSGETKITPSKVIKANTGGMIQNIKFDDQTGLILPKDLKYTFELSNGFGFAGFSSVSETGKFAMTDPEKPIFRFEIDPKDNSKAYLTILNQTTAENGAIDFNNVIIMRKADTKYNYCFLNVTGSASIYKSKSAPSITYEYKNSVKIAEYSEDNPDLPLSLRTAATTTEATTEATTANTQLPTRTGEAKNTLTFTVGEKGYTLNGKRVKTSAACLIVDGNTYLPLRPFLNALGIPDSKITYNAEEKSAEIKTDKITMKIVADSPFIMVNSNKIPAAAEAKIIDSWFYLPVRTVANASGISNDNITYDSETKTVTIKY